MLIEINGAQNYIPSTLESILLGDFIRWKDEYGNVLEEELQTILEADYTVYLQEAGFTKITKQDLQFYKELAIDNHFDKEARSWYTFWTGCDFLKMAVDDSVVAIYEEYRLIRMLLKQSEEQAFELPVKIDFNNEEWYIQRFEVNPQSRMTFNEIITSKEVLRQLHKLSKGKWEGLLYLCCIFLRKQDEPFDDTMIHEGGSRMLLMEKLPMSAAIKVAFFLKNCVSTWAIISASSVPPVGILNLN